MVQTFDLFTWWAISISWGIAFLILVSFYLYAGSRSKRDEKGGVEANRVGVFKDFAFVWVLIGLLVFYIVSVKTGSSLVFALGNIIVEVLLITYLIINRPKATSRRRLKDND